MWKQLALAPKPLREFPHLPDFAFQFVFRNLGEFRAPFLLLTTGRVLSSILKFIGVYLLGDVISNITTLTVERIFYFYFPAYLFLSAASELLDYYTRRYGEAFPTVYADALSLRCYATLMQFNFRKLFNLSKERLNALIARYVNHVQSFLTDWIWGTTSRITNLVIVLVILYIQSPVVLLVNLGYMAVFLALALRLSAKFSGIAQRYSEQLIETSSRNSRFTLNLNTVKRLNITDFFLGRYREALDANWDCLEEYKNFHARRWLIQLNLFNLLYLITLFYGVYQVKVGALSLGFLVLIKYSFDQLWGILVYIIEYYVTLLQQREDTRIVRRELEEALSEEDRAPRETFKLGAWKEISLSNVEASFESKGESHEPFAISIEEFRIRRGEKVAVIGPSGSGKSSLLNLLMTLIPFHGRYRVDGEEVGAKTLAPDEVVYINNVEPLFNLTLRDNILLGRPLPEEELKRILAGVRADFLPNLEARYGSAAFNLSAGQEQRVRLARGLTGKASLYLLDEPFNGIDPANKHSIIEFLKTELTGAALVLVTHHSDELEIAERVYDMKDGTLREAR